MKTFAKICFGFSVIAIIAGVVLIIVASMNGASWHGEATYSYEESYQDIKAIDIKINYGEVTIKSGDEFHVQGENLIEDGFESYVENGRWIIKQENDVNSSVDLFGFNITPGQYSIFGFDNNPEIVVTVPKDFVLEEFNIDLGAGSVQADTIQTIEGKFVVGAGALHIDELEVTGQSEYSLGTGEMKIDRIEANDIDLSCGTGYVKMAGIITGDNEISCGVGSINMDLEGNTEDYGYEVDCGIGSVSINNENYHGIVKKSINSNADNSFVIDCGIGHISIKIN